MVQVQ
jgi:hypothetical protein